MASRLPRVMLHSEASNFFKDEILPIVRFAFERDAAMRLVYARRRALALGIGRAGD